MKESPQELVPRANGKVNCNFATESGSWRGVWSHSHTLSFPDSGFQRHAWGAFRGLERQEMKGKGIDKGGLVRVVFVALGLSLAPQAGFALDRWEELTQAGLKLQLQGRKTEAEAKLRDALNVAEESGQDASRLAKSLHNLGAF